MVVEHAGAITIDIVVTPRASRAKLGPVHDGRLKVAVTSPPVEGEANQAVIELFAKTLRVARSTISIVSGETSRRKTVRIVGVARAAIEALVA